MSPNLTYCYSLSLLIFFNATATTEIYTYLHTLSLHDALPILVLNQDAGDFCYSRLRRDLYRVWGHQVADFHGVLLPKICGSMAVSYLSLRFSSRSSRPALPSAPRPTGCRRAVCS